jgi:RNA polymerase sigma-70 factor (ECF subfamily)
VDVKSYTTLRDTILSGRRDVADDLVQATCVIALESTDQVIAGKRLHSWLFLILHSVWLNDIRSRRIPTGYGSIDVGEALLVDGGGETGTRVLVAQVLKEALALPERQRTAVFLTYVEGLSYREAAEVLGVPIGTVLSRLATARMRLADALGPIESQQLSSKDGRLVETPDH